MTASTPPRHKTAHAGIYYRLAKEDRPDGPRRYVVWYSDANGVGHTETLPLGTTLEDARLRQSQLKTRKATGDRLIPTKKTVGELLDDYLELRSSSLKPKTIEDYGYAIKVLKKRVGHRKVRELSTNDIATLMADLKTTGLKTWTVRKIVTPLGGALKVAVREGWISSNPMDSLLSHERPKSDQREMRVLEKDEIPKLLKAASSDRWRTLFATLLFTGLRIGEALALEWTDVTDVLNVRQSKTKAGEREVMVIPALRAILTKWRLQSTPGQVFVFANAQGAAVSRREALRALRAAEKKADIPDYTLHELRHTFASILISQGEIPTLVAHQMGHADPGVTMKVYAHLFESQENVDRARGRLQAAFGGMV
jgi:integrase